MGVFTCYMFNPLIVCNQGMVASKPNLQAVNKQKASVNGGGFGPTGLLNTHDQSEQQDPYLAYARFKRHVCY